jgi:hypothetical protein
VPAPIKIISEVNFSNVERAFESVRVKVQKINEQMLKDSQRTADRKVRVTRSGADNELKEVERWLKGAEKREQQHTKQAEREQQRQTKAVEREAARRMKINEASAKYAGRVAEKEAKEAERAEQRKTRAAEREAARRMRLNEQSAKMAGRHAAQEAAQDARTRASRAGTVTSAIGRAGRSTIGTVTGVAGTLGAAGGGMMIANALQENLSLRQQAALLVNATRDKGGAATQTVTGLTGEAQAMAGKYGISAGDIMESMSIVSARAGGAQGLTAYRQDMEDIIQTAKVFGVTMKDMGGVVAAALKADVKPGKEMRDLIQDMAAMGKEGSIEISDLAQELAKLGGAGKMTNLSAGSMLRRNVGMAQIAAEAAVSPEESRTAIVDLMRDINTNAKHLKAGGINVYDENNMMNDPAQILAETMDVAMKKGFSLRGRGNVKGSEALGGLFTGSSHKIVESLMADYNRGGKEGVLAKLNAAAGAKLAEGERDRGLALMMGDPASQLAANMEQFKARIGELLPEFIKLLPTITEATRAFAGLASFVAKNPLAGIGGLFAASLTKELAAAGISKVLDKGLEALLNARAGMGGGGVGGNLGTGGKFMAGLAITATAVSIIAAGVSIIDQSAAKGATVGKELYAAQQEAENTIRQVRGYDEGEKMFQGPTMGDLMGENSPEAIAERQGKDAKRKALLEQATSARERLQKATTAYNDETKADTWDYLNPTKSMILTKQKAEEESAGVTPEKAREFAAGMDMFIEALKKGASAGDLANPGHKARDGKPAGM